MEVHFPVILTYSKHKFLETITLKLCKIWDIPISKKSNLSIEVSGPFSGIIFFLQVCQISV